MKEGKERSAYFATLVKQNPVLRCPREEEAEDKAGEAG
jgi:hypothetical protein